MKTVAAVTNHEKRTEVEKEFLKHESPDLVKVMAKRGSLDSEEKVVDRLEAEKHRIEKTISTLRKKLADVEQRIHEINI